MKNSLLILSNIGTLAILSLLTIIQLNFPQWLSQGSGQHYWSGSLLSKSNIFYTNISCNPKTQNLCTGLLNVWRAGIVLLSFDTLSVCGYMISAFFLLKLLNDHKIEVKVIIWAVFLSGMFHFIGFVVWAAMSRVVYDGKCDKSFYDVADAAVCGEIGSILGIGLIFGAGFEAVLVVFTLVYCWKEEECVTEDEKVPEIKELGEVYAERL